MPLPVRRLAVRRPSVRSAVSRNAAVWLLVVPLCAGTAALAQDRAWSLELQPVFVEVQGHDRHVLTIHETDSSAAPASTSKDAVALDADSGIAYRTELRYTRGAWQLGFDFFWFVTSQGGADRTAAAAGAAGPVDEVVFEVADRSFVSTAPGEVLYHTLLEDNDLAVWTADLHGLRRLGGDEDAGLDLQVGLRVADFDNDYRAVVGLQNVSGSRTDASSNYALMLGPLVGLSGELRRGRHTMQGYLGQSVVLGTADLSKQTRDFTGPFGETPAFVSDERFTTKRDVAIPISELQLDWRYGVTEHLDLGLGVRTSAWWNVPVPPGLQPTAGGDEELAEETIVFFGILASARWRF